MKKIVASFFLLFFFHLAMSQNARIKDNNTIAWFAYTGTVPLKNNWSLHTEYQWRRADFVNRWQQSLLRIGINYKVNDKMSLRVGYAWAETFNYGAIPLNAFGKTFTEHRIYEMVTIKDKIRRVELSHRFMLEQRWIGRYSDPLLEKEDDNIYVNRFRYMYRMQIPLHNKTNDCKAFYAALYDEIFIGFGKNVNENVFDQNRIGILLGYKFSDKIKTEGGYLNQVLQISREVNGKNVFQHNNGLLVSGILNF